MKKISFRAHRTHFLRSTNEIAYCSSCTSIVFRSNKDAFRYLLFHYNCKCGSSGYCEIYYDEIAQHKEDSTPLYNKDFCYSCPAEYIDAISVNIENIETFAYRMICNCGHQFEGGK